MSLTVGKTAQATAVVQDASGAPIVGEKPDTWRSSVPSIATVSSSGLVTAVSPGTTSITASLTPTGSPTITSNTLSLTVSAAPASIVISLPAGV